MMRITTENLVDVILVTSDISALLTNPLGYGQPSKPSPAFLVGGYFHTAILEPDKLKKYKVVESSTRNTKGLQRDIRR